MSPKLNTKEMVFLPNHPYLNNDSKPPSLPSTSPPLPSTSPPLSSSYTSKSTYFATNSSLLPSTKIPEQSKRHSIQPPKSPQMIPKQSLTRVTSVSNSNQISGATDPKPRASPPILKPPRKSKESKTSSDSEEPVFASRQEILGLNSFTNNSEFSPNYKPNNEEVLYDEPGDIITHSTGANEDQNNKNSFCPSPPPAIHTVSKLTSVLKMMFTGNIQNQIHNKNKDNKRYSASRSSTGSSGNASKVQTTVQSLANEKIDSDDLNYAQVLDIIKSDKNKTISNVSSDCNRYSKVLNTSADDTESMGASLEHQYANLRHEVIDGFNDLNKTNDNCNQTEHYVQNECEYARVVKGRAVYNTAV